jgi:transcriptional regulator with XRE-family HTH domain
MSAPRKTGSDVSRRAATRIRIRRTDLGMTLQGLAQRMADAGCPILATGIWKIESGYRSNMTADEAVAFAGALRMSIGQLLGPGPACRVCDDMPAADAVCLNCGAGGAR